MNISSFLSSSNRLQVFDHLGATVINDNKPPLKNDLNDSNINSKQPLIVLDSSYNPPTRAHEYLANFGREHYNGHMMFMLSVLNADKPVDSATNLQHRVNMISKLLKPGDLICFIKAPRFVDKLEILCSDFSTLDHYQELPVFIMGSDTLIRVIDHKYYQDPVTTLNWFFNNCRVANIDRPGHFWPSEVTKPAYNVEYFHEDVPAISSTLARTQISQTGTTDCVNADIMSYITSHGLYR